jgi:nucleoside-diphosphate-sugar epimerase
MKVLVTGSDGYIGVMVASVLLNNGFKIVGLDTGFYRSGWLYEGVEQFPTWIKKDTRKISVNDLRGFDAVVHLAELSNDPLGKLNPKITYQINHIGSVKLAKKCRMAKIPRFIYSSSCSVYGIGRNDVKTEDTKPNPQTAYAKCKVLVERDISKLANDDFSPTFLRNGTAYGASPRMRFDIVLNNLAGLAWTKKKIELTSDGTPWRPLVHILDICEAIKTVLNSPREKIHNQIFNVGSTNENYRVREIANIVAEVFSGCTITIGKSDGDDRSYRVSFQKIKEYLPEFDCQWTVKKGALQLKSLFDYIDMKPEIFNFRAYTRLNQLKFLIKTNQIDKNFFWRKF